MLLKILFVLLCVCSATSSYFDKKPQSSSDWLRLWMTLTPAAMVPFGWEPVLWTLVCFGLATTGVHALFSATEAFLDAAARYSKEMNHSTEKEGEVEVEGDPDFPIHTFKVGLRVIHRPLLSGDVIGYLIDVQPEPHSLVQPYACILDEDTRDEIIVHARTRLDQYQPQVTPDYVVEAIAKYHTEN